MGDVAGSARLRFRAMTQPTAAQLISRDPFAGYLGAELVSDDPVTVRMTLANTHCNFRGTAHGAVLYGLADIALSLASNTAGTPSLMIDSHLVAISRADVGDVLTAYAEEMSLGKTLGTYRVNVTNGSGRTVALFTGTVIRR